MRAWTGLHRDERGAMSIVSLFALLVLTILLGSVINSVRQVDSKIRLQNAADAATYSGGVVLARFDASGLPVLKASAEELAEHDAYLAALDKAVSGECVWRKLEAPVAAPA